MLQPPYYLTGLCDSALRITPVFQLGFEKDRCSGQMEGTFMRE